MSILHAREASKEQFAPGRTRYLAHTGQLMMVVFDFADGPYAQPDPPHSHPHEQVSYIVEGEVNFFLGDQMSRLGPGDMVSIPANLPHCIQVLTKTARLVDAFTPLREDFIQK